MSITISWLSTDVSSIETIVTGWQLINEYLTISGSSRDFKVTWSESHIRQIDGGRAIQLVLDQSSGCGFASKMQYLFGRVSMRIKLIPGDSAGTVTAFYMNSDTDNIRDELDFEFLGNRTGQPYTVQTNIYAHGKGDREQRINLWFDPSVDFHLYTILWNHRQIVFYVDDVPIRVYKNNEAKGIPYPKLQSMGVYSTLWEADDWATRGGLEKIDWSKAHSMHTTRTLTLKDVQSQDQQIVPQTQKLVGGCYLPIPQRRRS
ncbi:hypothetical protein GH714_033505 [Hevea brasiliensis]|uniref:GH16 domain-containing protein n=1 Tax=Hevea brasiliensis TaxID=3981 RepID=A0A6A6L3W8_HEVBR|nr:hypothetical protein GH714_033505 [Hevea brasiliensis]